MTTESTESTIQDPINQTILRISEDQIQGFHRDPIGEIARQSRLDLNIVIERLRQMLQNGTIRRIRQTMITTSLAPGALIAWKVPPTKLTPAFETLFEKDPHSGHVVLRTTDQESEGAKYRLWTTLKVPVGYDMSKHCAMLKEWIGAEDYILLPAKKLFALGVGHVRRRDLQPGARSDEAGRVLDTKVVDVTREEWQVIEALKRELDIDELSLGAELWPTRAKAAGIDLEAFYNACETLAEKGIMGRFSTFLEHVKRHKDGSRVTKFNALFHWRVPAGTELEAGKEVGRHHCMTHAYWREGGDAFQNVNIMGVCHGTEKDKVLSHKAAIDKNLEESGFPVSYTNVFWGGRSEIKPSEISPLAYERWLKEIGKNPQDFLVSDNA